MCNSGQPSCTSTSWSLSQFSMMVGAAFRCWQSPLCICRFGCVIQSPTFTAHHHAYVTNQRLHDQTFADRQDLQPSHDVAHLTVLVSLHSTTHVSIEDVTPAQTWINFLYTTSQDDYGKSPSLWDDGLGEKERPFRFWFPQWVDKTQCAEEEEIEDTHYNAASSDFRKGCDDRRKPRRSRASTIYTIQQAKDRRLIPL